MAYRLLLLTLSLMMISGASSAQPPASGAALHFDFRHVLEDRNRPGRALRLHRVGRNADGYIEFTDALQYAELDGEALKDFARGLDGIPAMTVGGWFYSRRIGEGTFFSRGLPTVGPNGERMFPPDDRSVRFCLGTDSRGFFFGTIHGNGRMPFPHVTLNEVPIHTWNQLVVVKDAEGYQKFYQNGELIRTDRESAHAPAPRPFRETADGATEPVRLAMPGGGLIGEAWVYPRELTPEEIRADFRAKRERYRPAFQGKPVLLREMDARPAAWIRIDPTKESWPAERKRILEGVMKVLGPFPKEKVPLDPQVISEEDAGDYLRRKVSIQVQPGDRMPAYLLIPKRRKGRVPAVICFYGTTSGAGKETTVGLSGGKPGTPPEKNRDFAVDMARAGFVAFAADYLRDGERLPPSGKPYDTTDFYERFPDGSIHGKDAWDTMRAVDYLQTLPFVDPEKIGMVGHSYGGHSTIFTAALEPRIKVAVANGPVSDFLHHGLHWAVPKGGSNSQSLPAMRPYVLDPTLPIPVTFYEWTALIAPRPLWVGQAVGERRPNEEENHAAVRRVYGALGHPDRVRYVWYAGDHDFPPEARKAAVEWFRRGFKVKR
ncbi:MAG: acetylxylan esterase [Armatimonadetes bacterium]|nr:acetylxylan esterase [Armatimonadota bacterium]